MKARIEQFCAEYVKNGSKGATQAAIAAGYSPKTAHSQGSRLLKKAEVQAKIQQLLDAQQKRTLIDKDRVLMELYRIATCDIGQAFDKNGNLLPLEEMPEDVRRSISAIKISTMPAAVDAKGNVEEEGSTITEVKFWSKPDTLRDIGRHFKMFVDKVEMTSTEDRAARLAKARARVLAKQKGQDDGSGKT